MTAGGEALTKKGRGKWGYETVTEAPAWDGGNDREGGKEEEAEPLEERGGREKGLRGETVTEMQRQDETMTERGAGRGQRREWEKGQCSGGEGSLSALAGRREMSDVGAGDGSQGQDRKETRGWGPDVHGGALSRPGPPALTQPLRPPQPTWERGAGHLGNSRSQQLRGRDPGDVSRTGPTSVSRTGPTSVSQLQMLPFLPSD